MPLRLPWQTPSDAEWSLDGLARPWPEDRPALLSWIRERIDANGVGPDEQLPDAEYAEFIPGARWAPGLFDRTMTVHERPEGRLNHAGLMLEAFRALSARSSSDRLRRFHEAIIAHPVAEAYPALAQWLRDERGLRADRAQSVGRLLIEEAVDRDAVKIGVLLIGLGELTPGDIDEVMVLGRHGEFTRYAVDLLRRRDPDWVGHIWELARCTLDYGRLAAVQALDGVSDAAIRDWLLREGWRGQYEAGMQAAWVCARTGGLLQAMKSGNFPDIFEIAEGLITGLALSPKEGRRLADYEDGPAVVELFAPMLLAQPRSLAQLHRASYLVLAFGQEGDDTEWPVAKVDPRGPGRRSAKSARASSTGMGGRRSCRCCLSSLTF